VLYVLNEQILLGMMPIEVGSLLLHNLQFFRFRLRYLLGFSDVSSVSSRWVIFSFHCDFDLLALRRRSLCRLDCDCIGDISFPIVGAHPHRTVPDHIVGNLGHSVFSYVVPAHHTHLSVGITLRGYR
jgi:hypothetical protein